MLSINELKQGKIIKYNNEPYVITEYQHARTAQRRAFVRTKLKHIKTGATLEKTFNAGDKVEEADLQKKNATFLYVGDQNVYFMEEESYEQVAFSKDQLGLVPNFLQDGMKVIIVYCDGQPASVEIPKKVTLKVTETEPAVRGNTASGNVMKDATVETGYKLRVPIFVAQNDSIVINTDTGEYVERANK